ncbi:hypothetical protein BD410DRAFT_843667 [Rickenella mellea]|uniref:Uncharacterized protein n=1 Tax=Rickenella mellea TaxID=50990 RepID=A0A4Y7PQE7_9AGAM|nr:hypothetical protein BD410DRAFT_843667 [Rickenella mellea]
MSQSDLVHVFKLWLMAFSSRSCQRSYHGRASVERLQDTPTPIVHEGNDKGCLELPQLRKHDHHHQPSTDAERRDHAPLICHISLGHKSLAAAVINTIEDSHSPMRAWRRRRSIRDTKHGMREAPLSSSPVRQNARSTTTTTTTTMTTTTPTGGNTAMNGEATTIDDDAHWNGVEDGGDVLKGHAG